MADAAGAAAPTRWRGARNALVVAAAAVALLLGAVLTSAPPGGDAGGGAVGSSYATSPGGAKAAYLLLASLGHRVERRAEPMGDLRGVRLAFLLAPQSRLGGVDLLGVGEWIEAGGTLVYGPAPFEPDAELLREGLDLPALKSAPLPRPRSRWWATGRPRESWPCEPPCRPRIRRSRARRRRRARPP